MNRAQESAADMHQRAAATYPHGAWTGTHTHPHARNGVRGDELHEHAHNHDGDAGHRHPHDSAKSITVSTPALDIVSRSSSLSDGLTKLNRAGRLGEAARELAVLAKAADEIKGAAGPLSKALQYEQKARAASDPVDRSTYLRLARELREKAGTS